MKAYELMTITHPSLDDEARAALIEKIKGLIAQDGGVVDEVDEWGRRRFAYEMKDLTEGDYTVFQFHAMPATIAELDRVLHITDPVVRTMLVCKDTA